MEAILTIVYSLAVATLGIAFAAELKRDLMMLQQNSYRNERYMGWLRTSGDTTSIPRLTAMALLGLSLVRLVPPQAAMLALFAFGGVMAVRLCSASYKKPLVWTKRARRIYATACTVAAGATVAVTLPLSHGVAGALEPLRLVAICLLGAYILSHTLLMLANLLLQPLERHINKGFYDDAARILASMPDLKIVGVTGSYGKTSTKHYLHRILSEKYDTAMTPGNFNTTLGVVRTVRECLKPYNEVFIVEMGAKQRGDIREICDLVHPAIGVVTAVGPQHLESFGSLDNVQRTKFELVDALPPDGLAVINNDFEKIAERDVENVAAVRYAVAHADSPAVRYYATDISYTPGGTDFTVVDRESGRRLPLHTSLVGECNISNLVGAVAVALHLQVEPEKIAYAVAHIEQVEHRLNIKRVPGGLTIIDDAYNSNPEGSRMAMEVLRGMPGQRIVVTPGMIELGAMQEQLNEELGRHIARAADLAIIVGHYNREPLTRGIASVEGSGCRVETVDTFADAQALLGAMARPGDTVIYENDLPDTFK